MLCFHQNLPVYTIQVYQIFSRIRVCTWELEPILWFVQKEGEKNEGKTECFVETLVSCILETYGAIYFNFEVQPTIIGSHLHNKLGDLFLFMCEFWILIW